MGAAAEVVIVSIFRQCRGPRIIDCARKACLREPLDELRSLHANDALKVARGASFRGRCIVGVVARRWLFVAQLCACDLYLWSKLSRQIYRGLRPSPAGYLLRNFARITCTYQNVA